MIRKVTIKKHMTKESFKLWLKKFLERILRVMAVCVLRKYKPKIIAITGSVGKTSAKEAVFSVLSGHFRVRKNEKNYNNEIGLPLTVLGAWSPGRSLGGWLRVFFGWCGLLFFPRYYPEILILEMGADRPGDISYLAGFLKPSMAIITDVSSSHLEFFKTIGGVLKEKTELVRSLGEDGVAILNIDNKHINKFQKQLDGGKCKVVSFGYSEEADVRSTDTVLSYQSEMDGSREIRGLSFKLNYKGTSIPVRLNSILARHSVYAALSAVAVGLEMGLNLVEISAALESYSLPPGRMTLIKGIKESVLIDDTYNASPTSTLAALEVLEEVEAPRKIAVLGDMLELGENTESGHRDVAKKFQKMSGDVFIGVGKRMQFAVEEFKKQNVSKENVFSFENPMEAGLFLQKIIQKGDLILIKGSQGMRMEKVVEEVMQSPEEAPLLLCRQDKKWKEKEWAAV